MVANNREKEKLFNFRPSLFAAIFLILGIVFAYLRFTKEISLWWLLAFLPMGGIALLFSKNRKNFVQRLLAFGMLFAFFGVGAGFFRLQIEDYQDCTAFNGEYTLVGTIENYQTMNDETMRLLLRDVIVAEKEVEGRFNAYLPASFMHDLTIGDKIMLTGDVSTDTEIFNTFGLRDSAITKKIRYKVYAEKVIEVGRTKDLALLIRSRMADVVFTGMDELPAALTLALLTGDVSKMDEEVMNNMRYGGISHIFAVSGLNVGALFGFCLLLFSKTPIRRVPKGFRFLLVVGILLFYSAICSFTSSVVRAAIMCATLYFSRLLEIKGDMLDALGVAAILILLLFPSELFAVGFQLSFLACVGLFLLAKPIGHVFDELQKSFRKFFPKKYTEEEQKILEMGDTLPLSVGEEVYRGVSGLLSASIAAQIATAPVLLLRFHFLSGWALLLNFIFVPFTDGIFTILLVIVAICCLLPTSFAAVLLYIPSVVWSAAMLVFEVVDFSSFSLTDVQLSLGSCVCYYGGIVFLSDKFNLSKFERMGLGCLCFAVFILVAHLYNR